MATFSAVERNLSRLLSPFPAVRSSLKALYQRFNFLLYRERGFRAWVHPAASLATPARMIGAGEPPSGTAEFFGYFDASPWSPDGRFYAVNQATDPATGTDIVLYDFERASRTVVATTAAATWQQGAMPRWLVDAGRHCLAFNTRNEGVLGTVLLCPQTQTRRFLSLPLQAVNGARHKFYSINYLRLHRNGTEYGYGIAAENLRADLADDEDGIWEVEVATGRPALIVSLRQLRSHAPNQELAQARQHEVNHVSVAPGGERLVFVHRYRGSSGQYSRLYLADHDGRNLQLLLDEGMVSHYTWLSPTVLLGWARTRAGGDRYYLLDVLARDVQPFPSPVANRYGDGHPSHHPGQGWIVTDSYPDRRRQQHLALMKPDASGYVEFGRFLLTPNFGGGNRVDLHPRWSPDGRKISIDAGHTGVRRNYVIDVGSLVESRD